jgi:DNA-binding transcriptional LysR family regulator
LSPIGIFIYEAITLAGEATDNRIFLGVSSKKMMNINLKQLRAFVEIYRGGKFKTAADRLHLTESAVSMLLKRLEENVGVQLFARTTRSLHPTEAAREAIDSVERILSDIETLGANLKDLSEKKRGKLRLAATPAFASTFIPVVMQQFLQAYPGVHVLLEDCASDQILPKVLAGLVDFGIGSFDANSADVSVDVLTRDYLSVICRKDCPLARKRSVRWSDLEDYPVITTKPSSGSTRGLIDQAFAATGRQFVPAYETAFMATAVRMVSVGLGIAVSPSLVIKQSGIDDLITKKIVDPSTSRSVSVVRRKAFPLSPSAESFVAMLKAELAREQPRAPRKQAARA